MKTWWYLCLHFTHFIIGGYWSEDLRRWSQATHQKAQCILWTCPVHSLLGRSSYQSHSPRRELWPACVWNNKVMNLTYVFPFKEEKEIEISYSHSQELPLTFVEFSPPFNINSDRNISKFYWIWKLFTFKLSEVTIINTTSFNVDSKKKKRKIQLYHKGGNSTIENLSSTFTESVRTLLPFIPASQWWEFKATRL